MGRLYDKKDLEFNLWYWELAEQKMHKMIANGELEPGFLDQVITEPATPNRPAKMYKWRERYDLERKRERMKLLRTGTLLRELEVQKALFRACAGCYVQVKDGKTVNRPCSTHREGFTRAKSAVYWAGEHNIAERNLRGQRRDDEVSTAREALEGALESVGENPLNKWETWYLKDKTAGQWRAEDAALYEVKPTYEGWLEMMLENEEMTQAEYIAELSRLKQDKLEQQESAPQWAGRGVTRGARQGKVRFTPDTRYNTA